MILLYNRLKRVTIYTGNLGSGKTEIAVNTALGLMIQGKKTALVDLDIINPFFRTRLVKDKLESMGLHVVSPDTKYLFSDQPAMSPAVRGILLNSGISGVFDIGGDDIGALVLGQYRDHFPSGDYHLLFVINCCRPFTGEPKGIIKYLKSIENASGMKVTGLVNNTNLGRETTLDTVINGDKIITEVSKFLGIDIIFTCVKKELESEAIQAFAGKTPVLALEKFMKAPWETTGHG